MPAALANPRQRVVHLDNGRETWVYEDRFYPQVGLNAVVGRPKAEWNIEPARFDEMRNGCYDIEARVADMDLDGVYTSVCFPSLIAGFAGTVFPRARTRRSGSPRSGPGTTGTSTSGRRPSGPRDPAAAGLARRSRGRGGRHPGQRGPRFQGRQLPENPVDLQLPSIHTDHWDPVLRACEETETVLCLHNGSSSWTAARSPGAPLALYTSLFPVNALVTAADWLWAPCRRASRTSGSRSRRVASAGCPC